MSYLPSIFRKSQSTELKPQKQPAIFSINLLLHSPLHPKSPQSKDRFNLSLNLDKVEETSLTKIISKSRRSLKKSTKRYSAVNVDNKTNIEEVESMSTVFRDMNYQLSMAEKLLKEDSKTLKKLKQSLTNLKQNT